ncbi:hypothetical protein BJX66DRAFT_296250 [Aspergillus keveii]|uniref:Uncharacterized protein n=1 Tax=Aspergillus keveii TaxID=714993 RepID=A0ABR4GG59_9EURO
MCLRILETRQMEIRPLAPASTRKDLLRIPTKKQEFPSEATRSLPAAEQPPFKQPSTSTDAM